MRAHSSLGQVAVLLLGLASSAQAVAWPEWLPQVDALVARKEPASPTSPAHATQTPSPSHDSAQQSATGSSDAAKNSGNDSPASQTDLNTGGRVTATGNNTSKPTHTIFNDQDPAGSVVMITPAPSLGLQLYKIGDFVTLGWNYTDLQAAPTAIDVLVSCSTASNTWTITQNMTFQTEGAVTWDTGGYQATAVVSPLLTQEYTLLVYDAESSISATAEAGYLAPFDGFVFGMYAPQSYTPLAGWQCPTCNAAISDTERRALGFALVMSFITVLSFTWFVTGFGGGL